MNQKEILNKLKESARNYEENLQNKNILILYEDKEKIEFIEIIFLARNFMHLTGVRCIDKKEKYKKANQFYDACLNNKLSYKDILIKEDGTTKLKLDIMSQFINMDKKCKMIGIYDNSKKELKTELLLGNISMCLGLIKDSMDYYVPNTLLKEDVRKLTLKTYSIKAILKKEVEEREYKTVTYVNKNINISKVEKNETLCNKINMRILKESIEEK